ncbi:hypothetical protein ACHAXH_006207 [Discostella pseudostelligera]
MMDAPNRTMVLPIYLCIVIISFASAVDASLFGVSGLPSLGQRASYHTICKLRGGGDDGKQIKSRPYLPYTLAIRDSIMIAHSFHDHPSFGSAGGLHGATYTVDVEFASQNLHPECNWVIDIGVASDMVAEVLKKYNYKNLDEVFGEGVMTTSEFMCKEIFDGVVEKLKEKYDDEEGGFKGWIKVSLWESHKAWASFEGPSS